MIAIFCLQTYMAFWEMNMTTLKSDLWLVYIISNYCTSRTYHWLVALTGLRTVTHSSLVVIPLQFSAVPLPNENFSHHVQLDDNYQLHWDFNATHIIFEINVKTNGEYHNWMSCSDVITLHFLSSAVLDRLAVPQLLSLMPTLLLDLMT